MVDVRIVGPDDRPWKINGEGEGHVVVHPHPPIGEEVAPIPFRQYLTDNGTSSGSNDLRVNGSVNHVDFYVSAHTDHDVYIRTLAILIADAGAKLNLFGALAALTNGIEVFHESHIEGIIQVHDAVKTNLDLVRLGLSTPAIGDGTSAFRADLSGGGADSYLPVLDFTQTFGLVWGLRLRRWSKDRIVFRIKDDLGTGLDQFDVIAYGIEI